MTNPAALTDHTGYWMRMVSNQVSQAFAAAVAATGVTVAEWVVLRTLYDEERLAPSALAERIGMTRGAISKLADRLITKRLIARADDPSDGRAHTLRLTPKGRRLVPELAAIADARDARFFGALSASERARLERTLRALAAAAGNQTPPTD